MTIYSARPKHRKSAMPHWTAWLIAVASMICAVVGSVAFAVNGVPLDGL